MKYRYRALTLLSVGLAILILDRSSISVAGPRMQAALGIGAVGWGWVTGVFTLAYAIFEIPLGVLGDRLGPRRVLTRIVLWWSGFTALTGMVGGLGPLLVVRFLFGAGEAGGYPNASTAIARWFPVPERGRAFGIILMASQLGGALAPLLVVPIQVRFGWRASFWIFGLVGPLWAWAWYSWFRDSPREKEGVPAAELAETAGLPQDSSHAGSWTLALRSVDVWTSVAICFCYIYTYTFFYTWFHTYLVKARGFDEKDLWLSSLPFVVAAGANLAGGMVSNQLVRHLGLRWGRCGLGCAGLLVAGGSIVAVIFVQDRLAALGFLALANAGITFQQPAIFAVCLDVGGSKGGAVVGVMNTAAGAGGFVGSLAFGYIVAFSGGYTLPLVPMAILLFIGAGLWLVVDPRRQIGVAVGLGAKATPALA